ncbi:DgyrCDS3003 [Dimorphilus gyrociliatus]|uniref:DgyrCDS3003 n=1 Tax=Dimorphilus gyrociliatus TaxID=2664684 RepID=A0A7I8VEN7_9ANNE|nr:DgyrCDS3003 [Dimorphilus gyrociliatus]
MDEDDNLSYDEQQFEHNSDLKGVAYYNRDLSDSDEGRKRILTTTAEQEEAIKDLFIQFGWLFDYSVLPVVNKNATQSRDGFSDDASAQSMRTEEHSFGSISGPNLPRTGILRLHPDEEIRDEQEKGIDAMYESHGWELKYTDASELINIKDLLQTHGDLQPNVALVKVNRDQEWKLKECFWRNRWDFESSVLAVLPHYQIERRKQEGELSKKRLLLCQIKPAERHILKEYEELNDKNIQESCLIDVIDETSAMVIQNCNRYLVIRITKSESEHIQQFFFEHGSSLNFTTLDSERFTEPREESEDNQSKIKFYWHVIGRIAAFLLIAIHLAVAAGFLNTAYKQLHYRAIKTLGKNIDYKSLRAEVTASVVLVIIAISCMMLILSGLIKLIPKLYDIGNRLKHLIPIPIFFFILFGMYSIWIASSCLQLAVQYVDSEPQNILCTEEANKCLCILPHANHWLEFAINHSRKCSEEYLLKRLDALGIYYDKIARVSVRNITFDNDVYDIGRVTSAFRSLSFSPAILTATLVCLTPDLVGSISLGRLRLFMDACLRALLDLIDILDLLSYVFATPSQYKEQKALILILGILFVFISLIVIVQIVSHDAFRCGVRLVSRKSKYWAFVTAINLLVYYVFFAQFALFIVRVWTGHVRWSHGGAVIAELAFISFIVKEFVVLVDAYLNRNRRRAIVKYESEDN